MLKFYINSKGSSWRLGMVVHACNSSYWGSRDKRIIVETNPGKVSTRKTN
jgi:hypothetical protein